jgi:hypothetical protein
LQPRNGLPPRVSAAAALPGATPRLQQAARAPRESPPRAARAPPRRRLQPRGRSLGGAQLAHGPGAAGQRLQGARSALGGEEVLSSEPPPRFCLHERDVGLRSTAKGIGETGRNIFWGW